MNARILGIVLSGVVTWMPIGVYADHVISNAPLVYGVDAIDPKGSETIDVEAENATPKSVLEKRSSFAAIQNFSFSSNESNIFVFSQENRPAVKISVSGNGASVESGKCFKSPQRATSGDESMLFSNAKGKPDPLTVNIAFGQYQNKKFSSSKGVKASGFVVCNAIGGTSYTVCFYDESGNVLSKQSAKGNSKDTSEGQTGGSAGIEIYFGYEAPEGSAISRIEMIRIHDDPNQSAIIATLDDVGFTTLL